MREFHLSDFPEDKIYVLLEKDFRLKLFNLAIKVVGSKKGLARKIGVSSTMLTKWLRATNICGNRPCVQCMPLWALHKILLLTPHGQHPTIGELEKHVIKYQAKGGDPIRNPNLPLVEDERLIRIFFHLAGDGCAGRFGSTAPFYYNTNSAVMKEFVNDLEAFGIVRVWFQEGGFRARFPRAIGHIMKHMYHTSFLSHEVKVPKEFWDIDCDIIAQGIKALADDEGTVLPYRVKICSSNKTLLEDVQKLLIEKSPEFSGHVVINKGGKAYNLVIRSGGVELFAKRIGFTHSQKSADLKLLLRMKNKVGKSTSGRANTRARILKELTNGKRTARELMRALEASSEMVRNLILGYESNGKHVLGLQELGLVEGKKGHKGHVWKITAKGRKLVASTDHIS